ncbi:MAG: hypothetical protein AB7N76_04320, partial [Planctomycetota bacterium]
KKGASDTQDQPRKKGASDTQDQPRKKGASDTQDQPRKKGASDTQDQPRKKGASDDRRSKSDEQPRKGSSDDRAKKARAGRRRGGEDDGEEPAPKPALQPLHIGLAVGALVLLGLGAGVALSGGDRGSERATAKASPTQETNPSSGAGVNPAQASPGAGDPAGPKPSHGPIEPDFSQGPPELPRDPDRALLLIQAYEKAKPKDVGGAIGLYEQLLKRLGPRAGASVERYVDKLRERYASEVGERYQAFQEQALAKLEQDDFQGALEVWREAAASLRSEQAAIHDEVVRVQGIQRQAEALVRAMDQLPSDDGRAPDPSVLTRLAELLTQNAQAKGTKAYARMLERAQTARGRFRAPRRERGAARVAAVQAAIAKRAEAAAENLRVREARAKAESLEKPISVHGERYQVKALGEDRLTVLDAKSGKETTLSLSARPELTAEVLERAARPDSAVDHFDLAVFCLKHRLFGAAAQAARKLGKLDAKLARRLPDIDAMRRASQVLRGDPLEKLPRGYDGARYDFRGADAKLLLEDFQPLPKEAKVTLSGGGLEIQGPAGASAMLTEIAVRDQVRIAVDWPRGVRNDGIVEVRLDSEGSQGTRLGAYLLLERGGSTKLLKGEGLARMEEASDWLSGGTGVTLTLGGGKAVLECGKSRAETAIPRFARVLVVLGGVPKGDGKRYLGGGGPGVFITWPKLEVSGPLDASWKHGALRAYNSTLYRALAQAPVELEAAGVAGATEAAGDLPSSDDPFALAGMSGEALAGYRKAWTALRAAQEAERRRAAEQGRPRAGSPHDQLQRGLERRLGGRRAPPPPPPGTAEGELFTREIQERGEHAGAWYGRALARRIQKDYTGAEGDLDVAVGLDPAFFEAWIERAELRSLYGDYAAAEADLKRAIEQAPDLARAHRLLGRLALRTEDYPRSRDAFGLALALDPRDEATRKDFLSVRQVVAGPGWEQTHVHQTEHFEVRTNVSAERAREVGAWLEQGRAAYQAVIGTHPDAGKRRATCLVFATAEGFQDYVGPVSAELSGLMSLRGLYSGLYKQLLFYEERSDPTGKELREVLFHEGFHRYADEVMPGLPVWASEGMAELLAGELTAKDGLLEGRLANLEAAFKRGTQPAVRALVHMSRETFYGTDTSVHYGAAWTLCRYLVRGNPPGRAKQAFQDFLERMRARKSPEKAFQQAFQDVDLSALDRGWQSYVKGLRR